MRDIEEILALYQPEPLPMPKHPLYAELLRPHRTNVFRSDKTGVSASVDLMLEDFRDLPRGKKRPAGMVFVLYTADREPLAQNAPGPMMLGPLAGIISNPYNWHALRMNVAAYLSGRDVLRLHLQQLSTGNAIHFPRYNPEVVERLLAHCSAGVNTVSQPTSPLPERYEQTHPVQLSLSR
jgi:hypothetical protein